jgi:hypothetical protein
MNPVMVASFVDELARIKEAASNVAATSMYKGMNVSAGLPALKSPGVPKPVTAKDPTAKPTNYSIVNTEAPAAAPGMAAATSKATPPPPVRT